MTLTDLEAVYEKSDLDLLLNSQEQRDKNSFLDAPVGVYPPRKPFNSYTYNLKKDGKYILKSSDKGRATIAIASDEVNIVDIFLATDFQGEGIVKDVVINLYIDIKDNFFTIKNISLASLNSGIIAWHKMGFDFYNLADRQIVRTALSKALGRKVNIKNITKDEFEEHNLECVIKDAFDATVLSTGSTPMYMEIIR